MAQCEATTKAGHRCPKAALSGGKLCYTHDPDAREAARKARSLGGKRTAQRRKRERSKGLGLVDRLREMDPPTSRSELLELWSIVMARAALGEIDHLEVRELTAMLHRYGEFLANVEGPTEDTGEVSSMTDEQLRRASELAETLPIPKKAAAG